MTYHAILTYYAKFEPLLGNKSDLYASLLDTTAEGGLVEEGPRGKDAPLPKPRHNGVPLFQQRQSCLDQKDGCSDISRVRPPDFQPCLLIWGVSA